MMREIAVYVILFIIMVTLPKAVGFYKPTDTLNREYNSCSEY